MNTLSRLDSLFGLAGPSRRATLTVTPVAVSVSPPSPLVRKGGLGPSPLSASFNATSAASALSPSSPLHPSSSSPGPSSSLSASTSTSASASARRPRRRRGRRPPTSRSIKLPPPTTPLLLRVALALWSILLSFWRSLVGDTRAVRSLRTKIRRQGEESAPAEADLEQLELERPQPVLLAPHLSSDEGTASEAEAEHSDQDQDPDHDHLHGLTPHRHGTPGYAHGGWVDPVTRAPDVGTETPDGPSDDEFAPRRTPEPTFSFRLRSAQSKDTVAINGVLDPAAAGPAHPQPLAPTPTPALQPIQQIPSQTQSDTHQPQSILAPARRTPRLLPNPMTTSLLDPSVPAVPHRSVTPTLVPRPHTTPFHLQKTLILDLDETLIHSTSRPIGSSHAGGGLLGLGPGLLGGKRRREGHTVEVVLNGRSTTYHVYKRPYVDFFLKKVASWYTLVIFTASMPEYADPVIDWLDNGRGLFAKRLYRESCHLQPNGSYIKDLGVVEPDLGKVCFMDNSPISYSWNKANALPIEGWTSDPNDEALLHSIPVLDSLRFVTDVRRILGIRGFQ